MGSWLGRNPKPPLKDDLTVAHSMSRELSHWSFDTTNEPAALCWDGFLPESESSVTYYPRVQQSMCWVSIRACQYVESVPLDGNPDASDKFHISDFVR